MDLKPAIILGAMLACLAAKCQAHTDSFCVYFQPGAAKLNSDQTAYLDSLLYTARFGSGYGLNIIGYADEPGTASLNNTLAHQRAESVKAYLLASGIPSSRIIQCRGLGNAIHSGNDVHQRRVDIILGQFSVREPLANPTKDSGHTIRRKSLRDLSTMKPGEMMVIENLQFKVSTNEFEPVSLPILRELADVLQDFPAVTIKLEGHICCGGKTDSSKRLALGYELSLSRARAVLQYLTAHGISASRLSCAGYGFSRPKIYPERSQEDSYLNRRVEIRVVSNK